MRRTIKVKKKCPSGKLRYRTQGDANRALSSASQRAVDSERRHENRYYECHLCNGGWHLTSKKEKPWPGSQITK